MTNNKSYEEMYGQLIKKYDGLNPKDNPLFSELRKIIGRKYKVNKSACTKSILSKHKEKIKTLSREFLTDRNDSLAIIVFICLFACFFVVLDIIIFYIFNPGSGLFYRWIFYVLNMVISCITIYDAYTQRGFFNFFWNFANLVANVFLIYILYKPLFQDFILPPVAYPAIYVVLFILICSVGYISLKKRKFEILKKKFSMYDGDELYDELFELVSCDKQIAELSSRIKDSFENELNELNRGFTTSKVKNIRDASLFNERAWWTYNFCDMETGKIDDRLKNTIAQAKKQLVDSIRSKFSDKHNSTIELNWEKYDGKGSFRKWPHGAWEIDWNGFSESELKRHCDAGYTVYVLEKTTYTYSTEHTTQTKLVEVEVEEESVSRRMQEFELEQDFNDGKVSAADYYFKNRDIANAHTATVTEEREYTTSSQRRNVKDLILGVLCIRTKELQSFELIKYEDKLGGSKDAYELFFISNIQNSYPSGIPLTYEGPRQIFIKTAKFKKSLKEYGFDEMQIAYLLQNSYDKDLDNSIISGS